MKPSMRDGLHWKLLGNGLVPNLRSPGLFLPQSLAVRRAWCQSGYPASAPTPNQSVPAGTRTPLASTVIPAPSYDPIRVGSCSISARLPFTVVSQPRMPSNGIRSTCGTLGVAVK